MRKGEKRPDLYKARIGNCLKCNAVFRAVSDFKTRKQKYCSKECWSVRAPKFKLNCLRCGDEIFTYIKTKKYCSKECANKARIGTALSEETKKKMSESAKGFMPVNTFKSGEDHPFWNPERTDQRERKTSEYKEWRIIVLKRDNYQCKICGIKSEKGSRIIFDVDHIKGFAQYPEYRLDIDNGRTLCRPCHKKTHNWGRKKINNEQFTGQKATLEEALND